MSPSEFQIDYTSARGSNTGDEYHELWAARQVLKLLDAGNSLSVVTVEGLTANEGTDKVWDGVDCSLLFGGDDAASAERVEVQQLKYSAASSSSAWTTSRLCTGKSGGPKTSPIRRLADAYKGLIAKRPGKPSSTLRITLVSNQPVASQLVTLVEEARSGIPGAYDRSWKPGLPDLHRLVHASGLKPAEFVEFAKVLDLQCASGSRFAVEDGMLKEIAGWTDAELLASATRLRDYIRKRMLPEAAGEAITREKVLVQFAGVSEDYTLFPCPSKIDALKSAVTRPLAAEIAGRMKTGVRHLCLHGGGGAGKTTALQQIEQGLPAGSLMVVFDCYGAGSYLDASALRHRPQDAFVQLTNEIAYRLGLPLLLVPQALRDYPRAFRKRLDSAAAAIAATSPEALLVVAIDAADNSVLAAQTRSPPEASFVNDLVTMDALPENVRVLISARTGRLPDLRLPASFERFPLPAFSQDETASNAHRYWAAPSNWVEDFHHLSGGVPRVQAYAFESAASTPEHALDALRPIGKDLDQVFREQFLFALRKNARESDLARLCAGLISLPRPIPAIDLAMVLGQPQAMISDICADLAPGVRNAGGLISFADEDFEAFVRTAAQPAIDEVRARAAEHLHSRSGVDSYAALNVAPALLIAGRNKDLLDLVEREPQPSLALLPDPIRRREVQVQRLQLAIRVCREAKDAAHALRFVLIGAEAMKTEQATLVQLVANPDLTSRYAKDTASRLVLGDPGKIAIHGPLLLHLLADDAARGDAISVREGWRRIRAWESARRDDFNEKIRRYGHATAWQISPRDIAAAIRATLLLEGAVAAVGHFRRVRPRHLARRLAKHLVSHLLAEGRTEDLERAAERLNDVEALFLLVPMAAAGRNVDLGRVASGLRLMGRWIRKAGIIMVRAELSQDEVGLWTVETVLTAAEILIARNGDRCVAIDALSPFLDPELRRIDKVHESHHLLVDAFLRAVTLTDVLAGGGDATLPILTPRPERSDEEKKNVRYDGHADDHDRKMRELIDAFLELYATRARLLVASTGNGASDAELFGKATTRLERDSWRIDRRYGTAAFRAKAAESFSLLLATDIPPALIMDCALVVRRGWSPSDGRGLFFRLAAVPSLHDPLIASIAQAAAAKRTERSPAGDRSEALSSYASLMATISPSDADVIFQWSIEVAGELDTEVVDQLRLISQMTIQSHSSVGSEGHVLASKLTEVIQDAAIRIDSDDHFPWHDSIWALAHLDYPTALAAAARWDDSDLAALHVTLDSALKAGLELKALSAPQAASVTVLLQNNQGEVLRQICEQSERDGRDASAGMAEELARDCLLGRLDHEPAIRAFIAGDAKGNWSSRLGAQQAFQDTLAAAPCVNVGVGGPTRDSGGEQSAPTHSWDEAVLVDAALLGAELLRIQEQSRKDRHHRPTEDLLSQAAQHVPGRLRIDHLEALLYLEASWGEAGVLHALLARLEAWGGSPSVAQWRDQHIADLLSRRLAALCRYLPHHDNELRSALAMARAAGTELGEALLRGIELNFDRFRASDLFAVSGVVTGELQSKEVSELCGWYIHRLAGRITDRDREGVTAATIPEEIVEALGRFFYAMLGDVDVRVRWRCAHGLRRLARMGEHAILDAVVAQYARTREPAFRMPDAPFYWVAARLWLIISLDRIALESPEAVAKHANWLQQVALDEEFPHLLVRGFARDACLKLIEAGHFVVDSGKKKALAQVNCSQLPRSRKKRDYGRSFDSFHSHDEGLRFHFDGLDTLRYWYDPLLRSFADVTPREFLVIAERWIVDAWGARSDDLLRAHDPRKSHLRERNWYLYSKSHGSNPTMEDFQAYLEWNAMWCAAGQLLRSRPLAARRYGVDELEERIGYNMLTMPPLWLADLAGPVPLQTGRWQTPSHMDKWIKNVSDDDFLAELMVSDVPGFVVANAYIDDRSSEHHQTVRVSTALVSPQTAHALVRALQTTEDSSAFYICPEGHDLEIDEPGFQLSGWLVSPDGDTLLDEKDVFRNGVGRIDYSPGKSITQLLGLEYGVAPEIGWYRAGEQTPSFIYQAWGSQETETERDRRFGRQTESSGHRLLVCKCALAEFLDNRKQDLIAEVEITRREPRRSEYSDHEEEPKEVEFERILLLRRDGSIQAAERDIGTWRPAGS
ncbi:hypothetical protein Q0S62_00810 [Stenotrophomonas indicatrix]|uniref:hypothetical protein n=1 Tax=Stenotrophomonas indicatrix TaxID=2045451 RepID=UPI00264AAB37|nr:hypothetical protein [Stenotrophomonas indicatrix]MDN8646964.1 hypothetical protein [Stenotrophomonas indicatrix]